MPRAVTIVRRAAVRPGSTVDVVGLDHAGRSRADGALTAEGGLAFELALPKAGALEDGDALRLDDGRMVAVRADPEALLEVRAGNPARLMRLAWQLGGSHVPAEIGAEVLYVPQTPAAAELARGQGCTATPTRRPFRPEREAHDHSQCGHDHGHDHAHAHAHDPAHGHDHAHDDAHAAAHARHGHSHDHDHGHAHGPSHGQAGHVHGPGCNHDH